MFSQWKKFLIESKDNHFDHNIDKIVLAIESSKPNIDTSAFYYEFADKNDFKSFLQIIGADKVLSEYKIEKKLGAGAVGFAFSLEEPHEGYVLKFQMSDRTYGADYLKDVYERQQRDEFKPNEVRVLEAFERKEKIGVSTATICVFVMSKVSMENIAGLTGKPATPDDFFQDFENSWAMGTVEYLVSLEKSLQLDQNDPEVQRAIANTMKYLKINTGMNTIDFQKFFHIYKNSSIENAAKYFYKVKKDKFNFLSQEQFVSLFKEIYEQALAAIRAGRTLDLHGGNFGFRPKSDVPLSFDV